MTTENEAMMQREDNAEIHTEPWEEQRPSHTHKENHGDRRNQRHNMDERQGHGYHHEHEEERHHDHGGEAREHHHDRDGRPAQDRNHGHDGAGDYDGKGGHKRHHEGHDHGTDDMDSLTGLLRRCGHILHHRGGKAHGQEHILKIIAQNGRMNQKELQEALEIQPASVSELISKLEAKGLVQSERDEQDKRKALLTITEEGKAAANEMANAADDAELYAALTGEEQEALKDLLKKLVDSWGRGEKRRKPSKDERA